MDHVKHIGRAALTYYTPNERLLLAGRTAVLSDTR
jgi:hypothetical protein